LTETIYGMPEGKILVHAEIQVVLG